MEMDEVKSVEEDFKVLPDTDEAISAIEDAKEEATITKLQNERAIEEAKQKELIMKRIALQLRNTHIPKKLRKGKTVEEIQQMRREFYSKGAN